MEERDVACRTGIVVTGTPTKNKSYRSSTVPTEAALSAPLGAWDSCGCAGDFFRPDGPSNFPHLVPLPRYPRQAVITSLTAHWSAGSSALLGAIPTAVEAREKRYGSLIIGQSVPPKSRISESSSL